MKRSALIILSMIVISQLSAFSARTSIGQNVIGESALGDDVVKSGVIYLDNSGSKSKSGLEAENIPFVFSLEQNYPNPFNPVTTIQFSLPTEQFVSLKVYNILGNEVAELGGRKFNKGVHKINFNADKFVSGLYFYKIDTKGFVKMKKMMIVK